MSQIIENFVLIEIPAKSRHFLWILPGPGPGWQLNSRDRGRGRDKNFTGAGAGAGIKCQIPAPAGAGAGIPVDHWTSVLLVLQLSVIYG